MYSSPYEKKLLQAKLNIEKSLVKKWIGIDCEYSYRGHYKGLSLKNLIATNDEFREFRNLIEVIEVKRNFAEEFAKKNSWDLLTYPLRRSVHFVKKFAESNSLSDFKEYANYESQRNRNRAFMKVETHLRDLAREAINDCATSDDYLFISDIDEILDTETSKCQRYLINVLENKNSIELLKMKVRQRLWDFNNLNPSGRHLIHLVSMRHIKNDQKSKLNLIRKSKTGYTQIIDEELVHEYTSCQSIDGIKQKFKFHIDLNQVSNLEKALRCNSNPTFENHEPLGWPEKVDFEIDHQPDWIKRNFESIKTNLINPNYRYFRKIEYPNLFS